jgi:hypothetical protein
MFPAPPWRMTEEEKLKAEIGKLKLQFRAGAHFLFLLCLRLCQFAASPDFFLVVAIALTAFCFPDFCFSSLRSEVGCKFLQYQLRRVNEHRTDPIIPW